MLDDDPGKLAGCFFVVWFVAFGAGLALLGTIVWAIIALVHHYT